MPKDLKRSGGSSESGHILEGFPTTLNITDGIPDPCASGLEAAAAIRKARRSASSALRDGPRGTKNWNLRG